MIWKIFYAQSVIKTCSERLRPETHATFRFGSGQSNLKSKILSTLYENKFYLLLYYPHVCIYLYMYL